MNDVAICVLLASYNGEKYIREQIESIKNQKKIKKVDIFISDDGSTDKTLSIIKNLITSSDKKNVFFLKEKNPYKSPTSNFLHLIKNVNLESYDAICFSDQDDIWFDDKLINSWEKIYFGKYDGYSSSFISLHRRGYKKYVNKSFSQKKYDYVFEAPGPGCTFMMRKDFLMTIKDFLLNSSYENEIPSHDWFIYYFARVKGFSWFIDSNPTIYYRQHSQNFLGTNTGFSAFFKRFKMILSSGYRKQVQKNIEILSLDANFKSYIQKKSILGNLNLFFHSNLFRRKKLDVFILSCLFIMMIF